MCNQITELQAQNELLLKENAGLAAINADLRSILMTTSDLVGEAMGTPQYDFMQRATSATNGVFDILKKHPTTCLAEIQAQAIEDEARYLNSITVSLNSLAGISTAIDILTRRAERLRNRFREACGE